MANRDGDRATRRRIIERPRLLRLLDEAEARIILLVAPAGYGKTTLARQWLAESLRRAAWYRASAGSTDPATLANGLAETASEILPRCGTRLRNRLRATNAPTPEAAELARLLADDLRTWPADACLVIDDHHILSSSTAEDLVGELIAASSVCFLITSRSRPAWVTARRLIYGEVCEVSKADLAFTCAEADATMLNRAPGEAAKLHRLSAGWPAIIGLAALTTEQAPANIALPGAVYDFFAEELLTQLPEETQRDLLAISPAPSLTPDLLRHMFGARAAESTAQAVEAGFFNVTNETEFELHPLLRAFLLRKLGEIDPTYHSHAASQIAQFLLRDGAWDDAAAMIDAFDLRDLWEILIGEALDDYLAFGRIRTLSDWVDRAARAGVDVPILHLARSELDFRRAWYVGSERNALRALQGLDLEHTRVSRAWFRAGQAAHFRDDAETATKHYEEALAAAQSLGERRQALWGLFNLAAEIESSRAVRYLTEFEEAGPLDTTSRVRVTGARLALAVRAGGLRPPLEEAMSLLPVVASVTDPVARSGFLNALAHGLVVSARYREAQRIAADELTDARSHRLFFVLPHARLLRAAANLGLRRFRAASRELETLRFDPEDAHVAINRSILQAKLALAGGKFAEAAECVARDWAHPPSSAMLGELLAMRAIVHAAMRDAEAAQACAARVRDVTQAVEAISLADWAEALSDLDQTDDPRPLLAVLDRMLTVGTADSFVVAYRARPSILRTLVEADRACLPVVRDVLGRANDLDLVPHDSGSPGGHADALSQREHDVYELLSRGLSNREIAKALFISEATVKVHVRQILKKLNVRSRTEAAVLHASSRRYGDD